MVNAAHSQPEFPRSGQGFACLWLLQVMAYQLACTDVYVWNASAASWAFSVNGVEQESSPLNQAHSGAAIHVQLAISWLTKRNVCECGQLHSNLYRRYINSLSLDNECRVQGGTKRYEGGSNAEW